MSFLAPLYLLGALAVSLPVLLHLIRRTPRGRQPFSSLMFLSPSPPRITRRSRIEHWLLLLLRAAALILLALAFGRPFLRETASLPLDTGPGQRVAILVDTSASMRRPDLWRQAVARVDQVLANLAPADEVGLVAFDDTVRIVADWTEPLPDLAARRARIKAGMTELSPTWKRGDLGQALVTVSDRLAAALGEQRDDRPSSVVLVSDIQHGSDLSALQAYEWPLEVMLRVEALQPASSDNAGVRLLEDDEVDQPGWRVRVTNAAGSASEQFTVAWGGVTSGDQVSVYVPAGQSRVVRLNAPPTGADRIHLTGDTHDFDNDFYFSPIQKRELHVAYLGQDASDDPRGLRYFLERVWTETARRKVQLDAWAGGESSVAPSARDVSVAVVSSPLEPAQLDMFRSYVRGGGTALLIVSDAATASSLVEVTSGVTYVASESDSKAKPSNYAMLGEIDFRHPVFASLAGPRYNDFTKVRFWKHQRFTLAEDAQAQVLARFDDESPAIWEQKLGSGKLLWFACGWRPADSQLALSSKFVPLLSRVLDHLTGTETRRVGGWRIGQPVPLGVEGSETAMVTKPAGQVVPLAAKADQFRDTDEPGLYHLQHGTETSDFAVNLDPSESDTAPLSVAQFEQLGVRMGRHPTPEEQLERQRQLRDTELESRQKLWRWLLIGVLAVLGLESVLAGRLARTDHTKSEQSGTD